MQTTIQGRIVQEHTIYCDDSAIIYHGDGTKIIDDLTFDAVVTDPPYGYRMYKHDLPVPIEYWEHLLNELKVKLAIFGYPEELSWIAGQLGKPDEWVTWWPTNLFGRSSQLMRTSQAIAVWGDDLNGKAVREPRSDNPAGKAIAKLRGNDTETRTAGDVWRDFSPCSGMRPQNRQKHPNEKPVSLMEKLLTLINVHRVCDPFCGSGSTLIAAKQMGLKSIGIDVDPACCKTAASRLREVML